MTAKCPCQLCSGHIEFEVEHAGENVTCPHCGAETILSSSIKSSAHLPAIEAQRSFPPTKIETPRLVKRGGGASSVLIFLAAIIGTCIGGGLVLSGCARESTAQSVIQQIYFAIQYCTGFVLIGIAFLLCAINSMTKYKP